MPTTPAGTDPNTAVDPYTELANFFTSTSGGRANGRLQQALLDLQRGQLQNQQFGQTSANTTAGGQLAGQRFGQESANALNQAEFGLKQPGALSNQSVRGDLLANLQDVNIQAPAGVPMGTVTGGLRPSVLSDSSRQLGQGMARNALLEQMKGPAKIDFPTAPPLPTYGAPTPLAPTPTAGALDTALNVGGAVSGGLSAANAIANALKGGGNGMESGGNLGPLASALQSGLQKLFGRGNGQGTPEEQGPGYVGANGGYYGPEEGGRESLTQEEIDAMTEYFGGGRDTGYDPEDYGNTRDMGQSGLSPEEEDALMWDEGDGDPRQDPMQGIQGGWGR